MISKTDLLLYVCANGDGGCNCARFMFETEVLTVFLMEKTNESRVREKVDGNITRRLGLIDTLMVILNVVKYG